MADEELELTATTARNLANLLVEDPKTLAKCTTEQLRKICDMLSMNPPRYKIHDQLFAELTRRHTASQSNRAAPGPGSS